MSEQVKVLRLRKPQSDALAKHINYAIASITPTTVTFHTSDPAVALSTVNGAIGRLRSFGSKTARAEARALGFVSEKLRRLVDEATQAAEREHAIA